MKLMGGLSRVSIGRSMAKKQGQIDNYFTPGPRTGRDGEEVGYLFTVIFVSLSVGVGAVSWLLWSLSC